MNPLMLTCRTSVSDRRAVYQHIVLANICIACSIRVVKAVYRLRIILLDSGIGRDSAGLKRAPSQTAVRILTYRFKRLVACHVYLSETIGSPNAEIKPFCFNATRDVTSICNY